MPTLNSTVNTARKGRTFSVTGSDGKISLKRRVVHQVDLSWSDDSTDFSEVSEAEILTVSGLPVVNRSCYRFGDAIIPYLVCRSKSLRETGSLARWLVECDYDTGGKQESSPVALPADPEDIDPIVNRSVEVQFRPVFKDRKNKPVITPAGHFYSEPANFAVPIVVLEVTQYENTVSDDDLSDRTRVANLSTFRGKAKYTWMIDSITSEPVTVPTLTGDADTNQVKYILKHSPLSDGWRETRALIDTHYLEEVTVLVDPIKVKFPFKDSGVDTTGWVKGWVFEDPDWVPDGTIQPQSDGLLFETYEMMQETEWPFLSRVNV